MQLTQAETQARIAVLADLEPEVNELMAEHEAKRTLWFPSEVLSAPLDTQG